MALVRRHWKTMVFCLVILVGGTAWLLLFSSNSKTTAQAQVTPPPPESTADTTPARESLNEMTYYAVTKLRQKLMLRNEDLAALGCTGKSTRTILEELLGWYEANRERLLQARKARLAAKRAYRDAMRRVNKGPRDKALSDRIPQLLLTMGETTKQERELTEGAIPAIEQKLDDDQRSAWASLRNQRHMPGLYRYAPNLSAQQKRDIRNAVRTAAHRRMTAQTNEQRQSAKAAFLTTEANILVASQRSALAEVKTKMQQKLPEILQASRNALPAPQLPSLSMPELNPAQKQIFEKMKQEQQAQ